MSTLKPKTSIVPPGGFHFWERSLPAEVKIEGTSYEDVAENVLKYRLANGLPTGEPLAEIYRYVCETWPHFCSAPETEPRPASGSGVASISSRVADWVGSFVSSGGATQLTQSQQEAERRHAICSQCPRAVEFRQGCGSCVATVERLSFVLLAGRQLPSPAMACDVLGQHNGIATFARKLSAPTEDQLAKLPTNCWRR